jgi:hypothetical protein
MGKDRPAPVGAETAREGPEIYAAAMRIGAPLYRMYMEIGIVSA